MNKTKHAYIVYIYGTNAIPKGLNCIGKKSKKYNVQYFKPLKHNQK